VDGAEVLSMTTVSITPFAKASDVQADLYLSVFGDLECEAVAPQDFPIVLSDKAVEMVRSALEETGAEDGELLRVGVKGGGCAGFQYSLNFTDEVDDDDIATVVRGVKVVTDTFSANYLKGTELDYVDSLQGAGFKFVNPNAKRTCGCGSSFA
jgi:iron-sulfur cluster assembly accessory protein